MSTAVEALDLARLQVPQGVGAVHDVDQESAARDQHAHDLLEDLEVLPLLLEVPERGEEVQDPVEAGGAERQAAHVAGHARQPAGMGQHGQREVDAERAVPAPAQRRRVAAGAAGQVEHGARTRLAEPALDEVDVCLGLLLVAMRIEAQVLFAEPFLVPGGHPSPIISSAGIPTVTAASRYS